MHSPKGVGEFNRHVDIVEPPGLRDRSACFQSAQPNQGNERGGISEHPPYPELAMRKQLVFTALLSAAVLLSGCKPGWAHTTVKAGDHSASIQLLKGSLSPISGFTTTHRRDYQFAFNQFSQYVITDPVQPGDQLDWNKLPGLSDCGDLDLSRNGLMFGWRWRIDVEPPVMEITAYANNDGVHLTSPEPLATLSSAELASGQPLTYRLAIEDGSYTFLVEKAQGDGVVTTTAELPRACSGSSNSSLKWASGLYFGGTSTAPHDIDGWILEPA